MGYEALQFLFNFLGSFLERSEQIETIFSFRYFSLSLFSYNHWAISWFLDYFKWDASGGISSTSLPVFSFYTLMSSSPLFLLLLFTLSLFSPPHQLLSPLAPPYLTCARPQSDNSTTEGDKEGKQAGGLTEKRDQPQMCALLRAPVTDSLISPSNWL